MKAPILKDYVLNKKFSEYIEDLELYVKENPGDKNRFVDLLTALLKSECYIKYDRLFKDRGEDSNNNLIYRLHGKYLAFIKGDISEAKKYLSRALLINTNEPAWVRYILGVKENYFESVSAEVLYTAIPKNGSTSIKSYFYEKSAGKELANPHQAYGNPYFSFSRLDKELKKNKKKVVILRDPISRVKSYYKKNIVESESLREELFFTKKNKFYSLDLVPEFDYFISNFWRYVFCFNDVLHHLLPQFAYCPDLSEYDLVTDMSGIDDIIKFINEGGSDSHKSDNKLPKKMVGSKKGREINTANDDFLRAIYRDDYFLISNIDVAGLNPSFFPERESIKKVDSRIGYVNDINNIRFSNKFITRVINSIYLDTFQDLISVTDCLALFKNKISRAESSCLIRLGDGEGLFLSYPKIIDKSDIDQISKIHFGRILNENEILDVKDKLIESINFADFICVPSQDRSLKTNPESRIQRGIFGVYDFFKRNPSAMNGKVFSHANIHIDLYKNDKIPEFIANAKKISLISCRSELIDVFRDKYKVSISGFYEIPAEFKFGGVEVTDEHYPSRFYEIVNNIDVEKGELFFIGAGLLGKYYSKVVADKGGIAFDFGSIADALAGVKSRPYI